MDSPHNEAPSNKPDWQERVARKRAECASKIPKEWRLDEQYLANLGVSATSATDLIGCNAIRNSGVLTEAELTITEAYTASQLLLELRDRSVSASEVTLAFSKRAAVAQQLVSTGVLRLLS